MFADEAGNYDFSHGQDATRYFILTTVILVDTCAAGDDLLNLRRTLTSEGIALVLGGSEEVGDGRFAIVRADCG